MVGLPAYLSASAVPALKAAATFCNSLVSSGAMDRASSPNPAHDDKQQTHSFVRNSIDSDAFSLRHEDPSSEPSEGLLQHSKPARQHAHTIALLKTSTVNLVWILTWYSYK